MLKGKGKRSGVGFYFCGLCFSPVHPLVLFHPTLCNTLKNISNHPEGRVTLDLGEARFFCTVYKTALESQVIQRNISEHYKHK